MNNQLIINWAEKRGLLSPENKLAQLAKLTEETGELAAAILKDNKEAQIDAIGDIQVVLIILSEQLGLDYNKCLKTAYNEIKDRKGKMSADGSFVKADYCLSKNDGFEKCNNQCKFCKEK